MQSYDQHQNYGRAPERDDSIEQSSQTCFSRNPETNVCAGQVWFRLTEVLFGRHKHGQNSKLFFFLVSISLTRLVHSSAATLLPAPEKDRLWGRGENAHM